MSWLSELFNNKVAQQPKGDTPVDVVIYLASLATKPQEVDPILDGLREVTSKIRKNDLLTPEDEHKLAEVYQNLEQYLTTKDPMRAFDQETIRQKIKSRFVSQAATHQIFWREIGVI